MTAAADERLSFRDMSEAVMRQWAEANPGRVNDRDRDGYIPLYVAAWDSESLSLVVRVLGEKGADVNAPSSSNQTPLHIASSPDIASALLDRGADPARVSTDRWSPLMQHVQYGSADVVARLLQDPHVRATVNVQDGEGRTVLHLACRCGLPNAAALIVHSLLQAG